MKQLHIKPLSVAQYFIDKCDATAGDSITHLKIQKLLYYVQAWGLVLMNKSFFEEKFQAWAHGPVLPSVYHNLKKYRFNNLASVSIGDSSEIQSSEKEIIDKVWDTYGELSAKHLEQLTHSEAPWIEARGGIPSDALCTNPLDDDKIITCYKAQYEAAE